MQKDFKIRIHHMSMYIEWCYRIQISPIVSNLLTEWETYIKYKMLADFFYLPKFTVNV